MATLRELQERRRAEREKPTLAQLRARKQEQKASNGFEALRARKRSQKKGKKSKNDFAIGGVRFHNVRPEYGYWKIDISNGDLTFTMHNRHGSWMHDVIGHAGWMAEPARVAKALGTNMGQLETSQALSRRLELEFRERGIPTREQAQRIKEEQALAARRKKRGKKDDTNDDT
jgi:hypothetical protein